MKSLTRWYRSICTILIIGICLQCVITLQKSRIKETQQISDADLFKQQEKQEGLNLDVLEKIPSLGFSNLVADWSYLQFIQYFGDTQARDKIGYALIPQYFKVLVQNDPRFLNAYIQLSPACSIFSGRPDLTVSYIGKALNSMTPETDPQAYYLWFYKGLDEILFLGDTTAARDSYKSAALWANNDPSAQSQELAKTAQQMAEFLKRNPDSRRIRINSWMMVYNNSQDQRVKNYVIDQVRQLGGDVILSSHNGEMKIRLVIPSTD